MAKTKELILTVITPERHVLEAKCSLVVLPAHDGEIGILPERAPLMCELGIGELRYESAGKRHRMFIDGGFAQVIRDTVTVLSSRALAGPAITPADITAAEKASTGTGSERAAARRRMSVLKRVAASS